MRSRVLIPGFLITLSALAQYPGQYPQGQQYPPQYPQQGAPQGQYPPQQPYPDAQQQDPNQGQEPQDQPGAPVARLSSMNGDVSVRRGDSGEWVAAAMNAPLMAGDSISVGPGGLAEVQFDFGNFVRVGGDSEVRLSDLGNGHYQVQMARGLATWRVLRDGGGQAEISTPLAAVHPERDTEVRVEVAPDNSTRVIVRRGMAELESARGSDQVREGNMMLVRGQPNEPEFQVVPASGRDGWDAWNEQRDEALLRSQSPQYVSQDVYGVEDLDQYGRWVQDPNYGQAWAPNEPVGWSPYSNGQWAWEDYYGWTWVDNDPWGWAPFHYGSWFYRGGPYGWAWRPGPRFGHYWWHPAMVGFFGFGGGGFGVGVGFGFGNIGWVPLAPFEAFHPWYGRGWFGGGRSVFANYTNVNVFNTYRNARFVGGVRAVSAGDFQRGNFRNNVAVDRNTLVRAAVVRGAVPVTPSANNLRFSSRAAVGNGPRTNFANQRFFSRAGTAAGSGFVGRTPFAQQQAAIRSSFTRPGSGFGGAAQGGIRSAAPQSGWQRFGEPNRAAEGFAARPNTGGGAGWSRFGAPQTAPQSRSFAAPSFQGRSPSAAPSFQGRGSAAGTYGGSRAEPSFRSAPQQYRGGGNAPAFRGGGSAPAFRGSGESRGGGGSFHGGSAPRGGGGGGGGVSKGGGGGGHGRR